MKPTLRLGFADTFDTCKDFFSSVLSDRYDIVRDDVAPDYLIFGDSNFGSTHFEYRKCKRKIFFTGENVRPSYFAHDFAITFDHVNSPYHYRLPLYVMDLWGLKQQNVPVDHLAYRHIYRVEEARLKTGFCSFIVTNPHQPVRNQFFEALSQYKQVDSGGPLMNNIGKVLPREPMSVKFNFMRARKFAITFENGQWPGYVTEKILHAFLANTIPIYFGSATVDRDFNTEAFINCHDYATFDDVIKRITELDTDDERYYEMLNKSPFRNSVANEWMNMNNFLNWFDRNVYIG
jgi:hypothetical protein